MNYKYHQKVILRTPLKPLKTSFSTAELQQLFTQKEVQEALFLSSPNLLSEFEKWQKGEITDNLDKYREEEEKIIFSLLKYALRMHSRCTPYGLFAGCGIVNGFSSSYEILPFTKIPIDEKASSVGNSSPLANGRLVGASPSPLERVGERNTRLDMNFTCALAQELAQLPFIKKHLNFYPNNSSYTLQDKIRYVEYYYKDKRRIHQISAVDNSDYIQKILEAAKQGATLNELAKVIVEDEISFEEALNFVTQIADAQLLVSELEPSVTGEELLTQILNKLSPLEKELREEISLDEKNQLQTIIKLLQNTQQQLNKIDEQLGNSIDVYHNLAENLKQLNIPFDLSKLFQTDLYLNVNDSMEKALSVGNPPPSGELEGALTILNQLTSFPSKTNLSEFQKKFYERYEDKEVPLLEVMDTETGIGYAQNSNHTGDVNPLVNGIMLPYDNNQSTELNWNKKQSFLFRKLIKAQQNRQFTIALNAKDLKDFEPNWNDLPDSFSVMYQHLGIRNEKELLSIKNVGGSSAINLLGRFASSNTEMEKLVKEIADTEQQNNPNVIFAEIAHLPESRTGNILMRPSFRAYEIPYLSNSTLPKEQQITLDDLYLSVKYNQLILRSKRLNKQVIPRLGNAHNFSFNALPVYHFLCDLQTQNIRGGLYFDWGSLKNEFSFLPRVEVENVIISSATWQLKKEQFQELLEKKAPILDVAKKWQDKWQMPNLVLLADGDNELLINLTDELSLKMFVAEIKKRPAITLKECLFDEKTAIVRDEQGNAYTNEFIAILQKEPLLQTAHHTVIAKEERMKQSANNEQIASLPLVVRNDGYEKALSLKSLPFGEVRRGFSLGSEWLYYKMYCGVKTADTILTELIKPLTERLIDEQLIDSWSFIRYADPDVHLRVRFHFTNLQHIGTVVQLFQEAIAEYEQNGLVWKIQTDTYQREIERYGENTMLLAEQLFYYDSKCIVDMLEMIDGDEGEEIRWLFAIRAVDELLSDFNYSMEQKINLLENLKTGFAHEFNMNKDLKMQLDKKFRTHRDTITEILNRDKNETNELQPLFELLNQKTNHTKHIIAEVLVLHQNNQLKVQLNDLLASYIHMLLNRLFKNKQRLHEMVVYDFMWRTYRSELAQQKHLEKQLVN